MKARLKMSLFCSICYNKIFSRKELLLEKCKKIGRFFELDFRALPRFGAFIATHTKITLVCPPSIFYHSWKFESNIFISSEGVGKTINPSENQKNDDISRPEVTSSKIKKTYLIFFNIYQSWKFHDNHPNRFREILCTKSVRKKIIIRIIGKKKQ